MTLEQIQALAEHATLRIANGERAAFLVEGMGEPLEAAQVTVRDADGTLDILAPDRASLMRVDLSRVVGLRLALPED